MGSNAREFVQAFVYDQGAVFTFNSFQGQVPDFIA
jgi:hypothetical protein